VRWELLTPHEAAAAALFVQHNAKWVDRRLSTALAWQLLNARISSDLAADGMQQGRQQRQQQHLAAQAERAARSNSSSSGAAATLTVAAAAAADATSSRQARQRTLLWGLDRARLEAWTGSAMFCTARRIPFLCQQPQQAGGGTSGSGSDLLSCRAMALQLEREDPQHVAAEAVSGTSSGGGGATGGGGSGWDLQLSLDPDTFPPGFKVRCGAHKHACSILMWRHLAAQHSAAGLPRNAPPPTNSLRPPCPCLQAVCFAFGSDGLAWCRLGPLAKAGPTWWKVGFLASQLPKALPQPGGSGSGGLLLVGWWVPQQ
jgi:hypothetical protein